MKPEKSSGAGVKRCPRLWMLRRTRSGSPAAAGRWIDPLSSANRPRRRTSKPSAGAKGAKESGNRHAVDLSGPKRILTVGFPIVVNFGVMASKGQPSTSFCLFGQASRHVLLLPCGRLFDRRHFVGQMQILGLTGECISMESTHSESGFISSVILWMDDIHLAPPKKLRNDDSPVNAKGWFLRWCRISSIHRMNLFPDLFTTGQSTPLVSRQFGLSDTFLLDEQERGLDKPVTFLGHGGFSCMLQYLQSHASKVLHPTIRSAYILECLPFELHSERKVIDVSQRSLRVPAP